MTAVDDSVLSLPGAMGHHYTVATRKERGVKIQLLCYIRCVLSPVYTQPQSRLIHLWTWIAQSGLIRIAFAFTQYPEAS